MKAISRGVGSALLAAVLLAGCDPQGPASTTPVATPPVVMPPPAPPKPTPAEMARYTVLWGDLHMHTGWSFDAFIFKTTATPEEAYDFARGGSLAHPAGGVYKLDRPLDFLAVTEHSEFVGVVNAMADPSNPLSTTAIAKQVLSPDPKIASAGFQALGAALHAGDWSIFGDQSTQAMKVTDDTWAKTVEIANRKNDPGRFTALLGYEWTGVDGAREIHRNVIFRGRAPALPYTSMNSNRPEDLWSYLDTVRQSGFAALAIPHNSNLSDGAMFTRTDSYGRPMTRDYAETRSRNEPLVEITQTKGTSETHPSLSLNDEFAGFELVEAFTTGPITHFAGGVVRDALKTGLALQDGDGFNPYRFGMVGGTDSHLAMSPVMENNYFGTNGNRDGTATLRLDCTFCSPNADFRKYSASGLTAVWARENTREAIFDALERKETYATTGPRIQLRFFGGFDLHAVRPGDADWVESAYRAGVSMGGVLNDGRGRAPTFAVWALKDPNGANLDRVQIVKVWSKGGVSHEKIYDVALSDGRSVDPATGKAPPVGNTVNVAAATYTNTIGAVTLTASWTDPAFDPTAHAAYYVRVLEIPTPRWSTYDAMRLGRRVPADLPPSIQERGFSSPIWYRPPG